MNTILKLEKRILAILLASVLTLSLFAGMRLTVQAAPEDSSDVTTDLKFSVELTASEKKGDVVVGDVVAGAVVAGAVVAGAAVPALPVYVLITDPSITTTDDKSEDPSYRLKKTDDGVAEDETTDGTYVYKKKVISEGVAEDETTDGTYVYKMKKVSEGVAADETTDGTYVYKKKVISEGVAEDETTDGTYVYKKKKVSEGVAADETTDGTYVYKKKKVSEGVAADETTDGTYVYKKVPYIDGSTVLEANEEPYGGYVFEKEYKVTVEDPNVNEGNPQTIGNEYFDSSEGEVEYLQQSFKVDVPTVEAAVNNDEGKASLEKTIKIEISGTPSISKSSIYGNLEDSASISGLSAGYTITYQPAGENKGFVYVDDVGIVTSNAILKGNKAKNVSIEAVIVLDEKVYAKRTVSIEVKPVSITELRITDSRVESHDNKFYLNPGENSTVSYSFKGEGLSSRVFSVEGGTVQNFSFDSDQGEGSLEVAYLELTHKHEYVLSAVEGSESIAFTVDTVEPVITGVSVPYYVTSDSRLFFTPGESEVVEDDKYEGKYEVIVDITVEDDFFDFGAYLTKVKEIYPDAEMSGEEMSGEENARTYSIPITQTVGETGEKEISLPLLTDFAGNSYQGGSAPLNGAGDTISFSKTDDEISSSEFYLDAQSPFGNGTDIVFSGDQTEGFFQGSTLTTTVNVEDGDGSGIDKITCVPDGELLNNGGDNEIKLIDGKYQRTFDVNNTVDEHGVEKNNVSFNVKATDKVGNHRSFSNSFNYDNWAPRITETTDLPEPVKVGTANYYKENLTYSFEIEDLNLSEIGIEYTVYDKKSNKTHEYTTTITDLTASTIEYVDKDGETKNGELSVETKEDGTKKATVTFVVDVSEGELKSYSVSAEDSAENASTPVTGPLDETIIDTVAPKVKVTRTGVDEIPMEGDKTEHHNKNITFTVEVEDSYLDVRDDKNVINIKGWDSDTPEPYVVGTLTLSAEDDINYSGTTDKIGYDEKTKNELYEFVVTGIEGTIVDLAGNPAEKYDAEDDQGNFDKNINIEDGNLSFVDEYSIVIDKNAPVITIEGAEEADADNKDKSNTIYYFADPDKAKVLVTIKDIHLNTDTAATYVTYAITKDGTSTKYPAAAVSGENGVFTLEIPITDGEMLTNLSVTAKDYATNASGNKEREALAYIVDTTAPEVNIAVTGDNLNSAFVNGDDVYVTFKEPAKAPSGTPAPQGSETATFKVTVTDRNIATVESGSEDPGYTNKYYVKNNMKGDPSSWSGETEINKRTAVTYEKSITVKADESGVIRFNLGIIDLAGNVPEDVTVEDPLTGTEKKTLFKKSKAKGEAAIIGHKIVVDRERPSSAVDEKQTPIIKLTPNTKAVDTLSDGRLLYNNSMSYSLKVFDPAYTDEDGAKIFSGLKEVSWSVASDVEGLISTVNNSDQYSNQYNEPGTANGNYTVPVNITSGETNAIVLTIKAEDYAGNITTYVQNLAIDNLAPRIALNAHSDAAPQHGNYYNRPRYVDVTVTDLNFDPSMKYTPINVVNGAKSAWRDNGITHTMTCSYTWDADNCRFDMSAKDRAQNFAAQGIDNPTFFIDMTAPVINVTFDNNNARNGKYYNANRVANVNIIEHNFLAAEVQAPVMAALDGAPIAAPGIGGFSRAGDSNNAQIPFVNDGDYAFTVDYTDMAGNPAQRVVIPEFTIDKTTPQAIIGNVENMHAYAGEIRPTVTMTDINYDPNGYSITWFVTKLGSARAVPIEGRGVLSPTGHGVIFTFNDLPHDPENDGIYFLSAMITDLAGNSFTTETVRYSVNRFGSVYRANNEPTRQLLNSGFTKKAPAISIRETNPNRLSNISITVTINGTTKTLREGIDYKIYPDLQENGWQEYVYDIMPEVFMGSDEKLIQGTYVITIYSEDEAGNRNSNRTNVKPYMLNVGFVIDIEDPVGFITVKGLGTNSRIQAASTEYTVTWEDNGLIVKVEIFLNGQLVKVLEGKELEKAKGKYTLTVEEQNYQQTISATVYDAAGNKKELEEVSFFLNSSWFQQFIHNTGLLIGVIAGIVVIAGIIVAIVVSRRKKQAEEGSEGGNE